MESYIDAVNFAEKMINHSDKTFTNPRIEQLKLLNEQDSKKLEELIAERNKRNRERRKNNG